MAAYRGNVQECDATGDAIITAAGFHKMYLKK